MSEQECIVLLHYLFFLDCSILLAFFCSAYAKLNKLAAVLLAGLIIGVVVTLVATVMELIALG